MGTGGCLARWHEPKRGVCPFAHRVSLADTGRRFWEPDDNVMGVLDLLVFWSISVSRAKAPRD